MEKLGTKFALKDLGTLHYFLGLEATYTTQGLLLSQGKYAREVLKKHGMQEASHMSTPMVTTSSTNSEDMKPTDATEYRSLVGSLQYLTLTCPDITHAINHVCQQMQQPSLKDLKHAKQILQYLVGTLDYGMMFYKDNWLNLYAFFDAD